MNRFINDDKICNDAVASFGVAPQVLKLIEELGELTRAASRWLNEARGDFDVNADESNFCEEIVDVEILLKQIKSKLDPDALEYFRMKKILKLELLVKSRKGI